MMERSKEVAALTLLKGVYVNQNLEFYNDCRVRMAYNLNQVEPPIITEEKFYTDVLVSRLEYLRTSLQIYQVSAAANIYRSFVDIYRSKGDFQNYFKYLRTFIVHYLNRNQVFEAFKLIKDEYAALAKDNLNIRCLELAHMATNVLEEENPFTRVIELTSMYQDILYFKSELLFMEALCHSNTDTNRAL